MPQSSTLRSNVSNNSNGCVCDTSDFYLIGAEYFINNLFSTNIKIDDEK